MAAAGTFRRTGTSLSTKLPSILISHSVPGPPRLKMNKVITLKELCHLKGNRLKRTIMQLPKKKNIKTILLYCVSLIEMLQKSTMYFLKWVTAFLSGSSCSLSALLIGSSIKVSGIQKESEAGFLWNEGISVICTDLKTWAMKNPFCLPTLPLWTWGQSQSHKS